MISKRELNNILNTMNQSFRETEESNNIANQMYEKLSVPLKMLGLLKRFAPQGVATTSNTASTMGNLIPPSLLPILYAGSVINPSENKILASEQKNLKIIRAISNRVNYENKLGDNAYMSTIGTNNLSNTIGKSLMYGKIGELTGLVPQSAFLNDPNVILGALGALQGPLKGAGTLTAASVGGMSGLGKILQSIGQTNDKAGNVLQPGFLAGLDPTMLGIISSIAMNMAGGKFNNYLLSQGSTNQKRFQLSINYTRDSAFNLIQGYASTETLMASVKMLTQQNLMTPAESQLNFGIALIERNTSALLPMLEEIMSLTSYRDEHGGKMGQNVSEDLFGADDNPSTIDQGRSRRPRDIFQRMTYGLARFAANLKSLDPLVQFGNLLSGQSSTVLFNKFNQGLRDRDAVREFSRAMGISTNMTQTLHTSAVQILNSSNTYESKSISLLSGIYEVLRLIGFESMAIRKDGLGVERPGSIGLLARLRLEEGEDERFSYVRQIDELLGYIPFWHTISGAGKMLKSGYNNIKNMGNPFTAIKKGFNNFLNDNLFTQADGTQVRSQLNTTALTPQDRAMNYLGKEFIDHVQKLLNYAGFQTDYLRHIAENTGRKRFKGQYTEQEILQMDRYSGDLISNDELNRRTTGRLQSLGRFIAGHRIAPGAFGEFLQSIMGEAGLNRRNLKYGLETTEIKELYKELLSQGNNINAKNILNTAHTQNFAEGGHTGENIPKDQVTETRFIKRNGEIIAKQNLHGGEYVINSDMKEQFPLLIEILEGIRVNGDGYLKNNLKKYRQLRKQGFESNLSLTDKANEIKEAQEVEKERENVSTQTTLLQNISNTLKAILIDDDALVKNTKPKPDTKGGIFSWLGNLFGKVDDIILGFLKGVPILKALEGLTKITSAITKLSGIKFISDLSKIDSKQNNIPGNKLPEAGKKALPATLGAGITGSALYRKLFVGDLHGPMLPPGFDPNGEFGPKLPESMTLKQSLSQRIKNFFEKFPTSFDDVKGMAKSGLKKLPSVGGVLRGTSYGAILMGAIDLFMQDDNNADGSMRTFWDKLKSTGENLVNNTGSLVGGSLGAMVGGATPVPGGTVIGLIVGSMLGNYIQDKATEWWDQYNYAIDEEGNKPSTARQMGRAFADNKWILTGMTIGGLVGSVIPGAGTMLGGLIGGFIGWGSEKVIKNSIEWFDKLDIKSKIKKTANDISKYPGAEQGIALGSYLWGDSPLGAIFGGMLGAAGYGLINTFKNIIHTTTEFFKDPKAMFKLLYEKVKNGIKDGLDWAGDELDEFKKGVDESDKGTKKQKDEAERRSDSFAKFFGKDYGIMAATQFREVGDVNGNSGMVRWNKNGTLNAISTSQYDSEAGMAQKYFKSLGIKGLKKSEQEVVDKILKGGRPSSVAELATFESIIKKYSTKETDQKFFKEKYINPYKNHKNGFYDFLTKDDQKLSPQHQALRKWFMSQIKYQPHLAEKTWEAIALDGNLSQGDYKGVTEIFKNKFVDYVKKNNKNWKYSGTDIDAGYNKFIDNQGAVAGTGDPIIDKSKEAKEAEKKIVVNNILDDIIKELQKITEENIKANETNKKIADETSKTQKTNKMTMEKLTALYHEASQMALAAQAQASLAIKNLQELLQNKNTLWSYINDKYSNVSVIAMYNY